ncbi:MAG: hypothetical protein JNL10_12325 [Verrucomicrobiales bacterium]|nr:hypothetical protein [Verrucomicrobiales bacterium]
MHPPVPLRLAALVTLLIGAHPNPVSAETEKHPFVQDRLAIGMWVPPQTDVDLESRYREIADANFTVVIGTAGTNAAGQLALCERHGLRAIVSSSGPVESFPDGPACWGYLLTDEPNLSAFPELAKTISTLREKRPGRLGYVNLFPNYASPEQLGSPSYPAYVARFVDTVKPEVLSMDHYPLMRPDADRRDAYCENLEVFRLESLKAGIPFWNYFQSMPFADHLDPTEAQVRWQIFTSLAYGAKGVLYFCYWTPGRGNGGTGEFPKGGALLTAEGRRTRHYDEARRINGELIRLGPTLMSLTNTGVRRLKTSTNAANPIPGFPVRSVTRVGSDPDSTLIAGAFNQRDGRRAVLLVNHDIAHTAWPTVTFDVPSTTVFEVDKAAGRLEPVVDDSPELPGLQLSFGPGDGRLFLMPPKP